MSRRTASDAGNFFVFVLVFGWLFTDDHWLLVLAALGVVLAIYVVGRFALRGRNAERPESVQSQAPAPRSRDIAPGDEGWKRPARNKRTAIRKAAVDLDLNELDEDALSALRALGLSKGEARRALLATAGTTTEERVRAALTALSAPSVAIAESSAIPRRGRIQRPQRPVTDLDALEALVGLGYSRRDAVAALSTSGARGSTEETVLATLRVIGAAR